MDLVAFGSDQPPSSSLESRFRAFLDGAAPQVAPRIAPLITDQVIEVERFGQIKAVPQDDVLYIEADGDYTVLVRRDGRRVDHYKPIGLLEASLPPTFVRIHKSYLVRLQVVTRVTVESGACYFAVLVNGQRLPVSRTRYQHLLSLMQVM